MVKRKVGILAYAVPALFSGLAHAESSVTLYGVIDAGIDFTNNSGGHQLWHMQDGTDDGLYGSRWGLKGSEDLGGGLKTIFKIENGFNVNDGSLAQGGLGFGRQAFIGLSDDRLGTLTVGRQYDSVVDYMQPVSIIGAWGGPTFHSGDTDNFGNSFRVNNSIKYASPTIAGLSFGGLIGLSNSNAAGNGTIGTWSVGGTYALGGLNLAAAYLYARNPETNLPGGDFGANTTGAAIGATGTFSYIGSPASAQIFGAGGTYKIGNGLVGLDYSNTWFGRANGTNSTVRFTNYEAWAQYAFTPAFTLVGGYTFTDGSIGYSSQSPKYHQINLIASYSLSKATQLYAAGAYQIAAGDAQSADIFEGVTGTASSSKRQLATRIGILHKF